MECFLQVFIVGKPRHVLEYTDKAMIVQLIAEMESQLTTSIIHWAVASKSPCRFQSPLDSVTERTREMAGTRQTVSATLTAWLETTNVSDASSWKCESDRSN